MSKIIFRTLDNLQNEPTALAVINQNFAALQTLIDSLLSRDGAVPNQMVELLDMNGHKIINLPVPTTPTEPARNGDIQQYVDEAEAAADAAANSAANALNSQNLTHADLVDFLSRYIGTYSSDPSVDSLGNTLENGALYYSSTSDGLRVWEIRDVYVNTDEVLVGTDQVVTSQWVAIPMTTLASMSDVDISSITNGQFIQWNTGLSQFRPFTLLASTVPFTPGTIEATDTQAAIEEVVSRTVLDKTDIQFYLEGLMADGESLYKYVAQRAFTVPSDTTGFVATAGTAATGSTVVTLKKNGVQFGTITWSASGTVGAWSIPGNTSFVAGDIMTLAAPATPDTSLRDVIIAMTVNR